MQRPRLLITRRLPEEVHARLRNRYDVTANPDDRAIRSRDAGARIA